MIRYLLFCAVWVLLLTAQDCEETSPEPKGIYCDGATAPGAISTVGSYITGTYAAIVDGQVSTDRGAAVRVYISNVGPAYELATGTPPDAAGGGWCSGTVIGPHTVISAAHCQGDNYEIIYEYEAAPDDVAALPLRSYHAPYSKRHERYIDWSQQDSRNHDILLIYSDEELPGPYASIYTPAMHSLCEGLTAGPSWGTHNDPGCAWENNCSMRESPNYAIGEGPTWVQTKGMPGWICHGDSGGGLTAKVAGQPGPIVAGITSSTSSTDCKLASRFIKVEPFISWIGANAYENRPWETR